MVSMAHGAAHPGPTHHLEMEDLADEDSEGHALLRHSSHSVESRSYNVQPRTTILNIPLGQARAYWLGSVVCMAGFLFGYDSGIVGGVLTFSSFQRDFRYATSDRTRTESLAVGLQQLGAFVACFLAWPITDRLGRNKTLMLSTLIFCLGAAVQTINSHSVTVFYLARAIAGLGLGSATVVVPMYNSEMMPKELRGQVGSFFQLFFTFGIFTSYWIDYAVARVIPQDSSAQWRIPIGLQLVPAGLLGLGLLTLPESTRWLTKKGRHDKAWESLQWIRADDSDATAAEMAEIRAGVLDEARAREGFQVKELLEPDNLGRVLTAVTIFAAQQATGATAFAYFGPQYFSLLVGHGNDTSGDLGLLLTGVFGAVKVVSCGVFVVWFSERLSRRAVLAGGALVMAACQVATAAVVAVEPPAAGGDGGGVTGSSIGTVALIYMFVVAYNFSWGPLPWPYVSEIFPPRTREPGVAAGVASQWLFNLVFSLATPYMIRGLGWATFLLWGVFDLAIAGAAYAFLVETKGLSLEAIAAAGTRNRRKRSRSGR